jgi:D-3-phosphoglycerate dehydrogenase
VDLVAAAQAGIPVFNAPYSNTRSVAELVIAQAILLLRRIPEKNAKAHRGIWDKSAQGAYETRNKTLGIIGYGNIGAQLGILAESVGMQVRYYDPESKLPLGNAKPLPLQQVLEQSDVVTLHVPGGPGTVNLMNRERLAMMKPNAVLINASRGGVVEIDALDAALREGRLAGAALDVFPQEPRSEKEEFISPLRGHDNVILTPHIGGSTEHRTGSGRKAGAFPDCRHDTLCGQLPRDCPPGQGSRQPHIECAQERAGGHCADERRICEHGAQYRCPALADQGRDRLCHYRCR